MQIQISTNCVQPFRRRRTQNKKRKFRCVFLYFCSCFTTCVCTTTFYLLLKWRPLLFWFVALQEEWKGHGELCHKQRENKILTSLFFRQRISTRLNVFFSNCALTKRDLENVLNCFMLQCIFLKRSRLLLKIIALKKSSIFRFPILGKLFQKYPPMEIWF